MATQDTADPTLEQADRRVERAKASLLARVEQLKHKFSDAKETLDVPAQIAKHALPAVGIAFALGAAAGLGHPRSRARSPGDSDGHGLGGAVVAALGAFGLRVLRDVALGQLGLVAKQWWTDHHHGPVGDPSARLPDPPEGEPFTPYPDH